MLKIHRTCISSFEISQKLLRKWFVLKGNYRGRSQDGGGIGRGDHFLSYKFIKRITERIANFRKQLLIAS